jgi:hypothetical protein
MRDTAVILAFLVQLAGCVMVGTSLSPDNILLGGVGTGVVSYGSVLLYRVLTER